MQLADDYPVATLCRALSVARSSFYYGRRRPCVDEREEALRRALVETAGAWPRYGYRRLTEQLKRQGHTVGSRRVRRLMRQEGLLQRRRRRHVRTTDSRHGFPRYGNLVMDLEVVRPDQVWVSDITYIRLRGGFVYLAVILDVFTRSVRGWALSDSLEGTLTLAALERALERGRPEIHHSDQGGQYASWSYVNRLRSVGTRVSMAAVGAAWENGYAERLMRTVKEEEVDLSEYLDVHDARRQIGRFLEGVYQHKRIYSSRGYLTPAEFEQGWLAQQTSGP